MTKCAKWLDVDWVELGCRGWEIDETGAEFLWPENVDPLDVTEYAHLDRTTLAVLFHGSPEFFQRVYDDLCRARVPGLLAFTLNVTTTSGNTTGTFPVGPVTFT